MMDPGPVMVAVETDPVLQERGDVTQAPGAIAMLGRARSPAATAKVVPRSRESFNF